MAVPLWHKQLLHDFSFPEEKQKRIINKSGVPQTVLVKSRQRQAAKSYYTITDL